MSSSVSSPVTMAEERLLLPLSEAAAPLFLGISFGRFLKLGVIDNEGRSVAYFAAAVESESDPELCVGFIARFITTALDKVGLSTSDILAAGLSFPGAMNPKTNELNRPPNHPTWGGFPICERLIAATGLRSMRFCNNANSAAYGEYWIGEGKGAHSLCLLELDRGMGCGIIVEGREISGAHGMGGECGHIILDPSPGARWCNCLQQGHLEAYASATGLARRTRELIEAGIPTLLSSRLTPKTDLYDLPKMVYEEAVRGDRLAVDLVMDTAKFLGIGLVTILHTIDPECVLIGGDMMFGGKGSDLGERFLNRIREEIRARAFRILADNLRLSFATLGSYASFIGAAGLAREEALMFTLTGE